MIKCCWNCEDRQMGCHGTCERYKAEKAAEDAKKAEIRRQNRIRYNLDCAGIKAIKKTKREGRRK